MKTAIILLATMIVAGATFVIQNVSANCPGCAANGLDDNGETALFLKHDNSTTHHSSSSHPTPKHHSTAKHNDLMLTILTPPPCLNNTSTVGPFTDYFNMVKGIYHCQTFDVTVLHESPTSVMLHYLDTDNSETAVIEEAGVLNWHILSHQDDGVITTEVLVPNP